MASLKNFARMALLAGSVLALTAANSTADTSKPTTKAPPGGAGILPAPVGATPKAVTATSTSKDKLTYNGPEVMDPSKFFGPAMMGYASAKAAPEVMAKLFCYCGCDISDSHSALIDCFTTPHGMDCHICQEEAVLALKLHRDGASISEIEKRIDQQYSKQYPFQEESPAYKKYKASRSWTADDQGATDTKVESRATTTPRVAGPEPDLAKGTSPKKSSKKLKVKAGFKVGNCCSKDEHPTKK